MPFVFLIIAIVVIMLYFGLTSRSSGELLKEDKRVWLWVGKGKKIDEVKAYINLLDDAVIFESIKDKKELLKIPYKKILSIEDHIPKQWSDRWPVYLFSHGQISGPTSRLLSLFIIYNDAGEKKVENIKFQSNASSYYKEIKMALREKSPNIVTMNKVKNNPPKSKGTA